MAGWTSIMNVTQQALRSQGEELARLQAAAASGARINRASDDPTGAFKVLDFRADAASLETYMRNLDAVTESLQTVSDILQNMSASLARAQALASQASSGTYDARSRAAIATEIDCILESLVSFANRQYRDRYVFGGGAAEAPYAAVRQGGRIVRVEYRGGADGVPVPVAAGVEYDAILVGDRALRAAARGQPLFLGHTGAAPGAGTSSVRGDVWLTVRHAATAYAGASGIAPGASSAAGDTILGTGHTLTIDQPAGTVALDDGTPVAFTGDETDLRLANAAGDAVYVDTRAVAAGFQGTVAIRADGTLSIDDGASAAAATFAPGDAVTDSRDGRVLYVDTTALARVGVEPVRLPGTNDLFGALIALRDAALNSRGLSAEDTAAVLGKARDALQEVSGRLTETLTATGAKLQALAGLRENLDAAKGFSEQRASAIEDVDLVDLAAELARLQTLYQVTMASAARMLTLSLFDYLDT